MNIREQFQAESPFRSLVVTFWDLAAFMDENGMTDAATLVRAELEHVASY